MQLRFARAATLCTLLALWAGAALAQAQVPKDLLDLREVARGAGSMPDRLAACARLVPEAARRLPSEDSWRLRVSLDCADTDLTAGNAALALTKLDALVVEIRSLKAHPAMEIIAMKYRGLALTQNGRKVDGMRELEQALELAQQRFGPTSEHAQDVSVRLCSAYVDVQRFDEAIALCSNLVRQRPATGPAGPSDLVRGVARQLWGRALVKRNAGAADVKRAIELLTTSVRELQPVGNGAHALRSRRDLAYAMLRDGQKEEAEKEVRAVREQFVRMFGEKSHEVVNTDDLLRIVLVERREYGQALSMQGSRQEGRASDTAGRLNQDLVHAINLVNMQRNDEALRALTDWAEAAETARDGLVLDAAEKAQFTRDWHTGYQFLAVAYFRKKMLRAALVSLELSKARALLTSMGDMDALRSLPAADRAEALGLTRDASRQRQRQRLSRPGSPEALEASRLASDHEAQFARVLDRDAAARLKGRIDRNQVDMDVARMIGQSEDGDAYLSLGYGLSGTQSLMPLLLRRGRVHAAVRPFVIEGNLEGSVAAMRMLAQHGATGLAARKLKIVARQPEGFQVVPDSAPEPAIDEPRRVVEYLSEKILGPFRNQLKDVRRLVVSADGPTWLIPFDLLELDGQPLFKTVTVSFVPSVSVLAMQRSRLAAPLPPAASARLLAVGGANYQQRVQVAPGSPIFINRVKSQAAPSSYDLAALADAGSPTEFFGHLMTMIAGARDLPGSLDEVNRISRRFQAGNVTALVGDAATERRIDALARGNTLASYDYIHFATHGIAQTRRPLMSALVTSIGERDEQYDGYISAQEISAWNVKARLVVLSACDTAIGANLGGDGVLGLPYAFLIAGAATTVQTLWAIPDVESAQWMDGLYARVLDGMPASDALAAVKQQVALAQKWEARYVTPTPWAAFALYGY